MFLGDCTGSMALECSQNWVWRSPICWKRGKLDRARDHSKIIDKYTREKCVEHLCPWDFMYWTREIEYRVCKRSATTDEWSLTAKMAWHLSWYHQFERLLQTQGRANDHAPYPLLHFPSTLQFFSLFNLQIFSLDGLENIRREQSEEQIIQAHECQKF